MLAILTESQVLSPEQVCSSCLMADRRGLPRWQQGKLGCGAAIEGREGCFDTSLPGKLPRLYQCQMGFRLAEID